MARAVMGVERGLDLRASIVECGAESAERRFDWGRSATRTRSGPGEAKPKRRCAPRSRESRAFGADFRCCFSSTLIFVAELMNRVLLVDDDPDLLDLLRTSFEEAGFAVETAASGEDGLHQARERLPDAIVLDLLLPDINGVTVCETLREEPATASVPLLILTGVVGQIPRFAGLEAGADDYITKPVRPGDLVDRVSALLQRKAAGGDPLSQN